MFLVSPSSARGHLAENEIAAWPAMRSRAPDSPRRSVLGSSCSVGFESLLCERQALSLELGPL